MGNIEQRVCMVTNGHNHYDLISNISFMRGYALSHIVFSNSRKTNGCFMGVNAVGKEQLFYAIANDDVIYFPNNCGLTSEEIQRILSDERTLSKKFVCEERLVCDSIKSRMIYAPKIHINTEDLTECSIPIVLISGDLESVDKFSLTLKLRDSLENKYGIKVSVISGNEHGRFFGFYSFPLTNELDMTSPSNGINSFKKMINPIVEQDSPDIVLISLPGGLFEIEENRNYNSEFELRYIDNAVHIDFYIHVNIFNHKETDCMISAVEKKFNHCPDCLVTSNRLPAEKKQHSDNNTSAGVITVNHDLYTKTVNKIEDREKKSVFMLGEEERIADILVSTLNSSYERFAVL